MCVHVVMFVELGGAMGSLYILNTVTAVFIIKLMLNMVIFTHLFYCLVDVFSTTTSVPFNTATTATVTSTTVTEPFSFSTVTSGMFTIY